MAFSHLKTLGLKELKELAQQQQIIFTNVFLSFCLHVFVLFIFLLILTRLYDLVHNSENVIALIVVVIAAVFAKDHVRSALFLIRDPPFSEYGVL